MFLFDEALGMVREVVGTVVRREGLMWAEPQTELIIVLRVAV
jgi:hypothetical protein